MISLHIIIATLAVISSILSVVRPSNKLLKASYLLAGGTLASGVALVVIEPTQLTHTCIMGLIFFSIIGYCLYTARKKLAYSQTD